MSECVHMVHFNILTCASAISPSDCYFNNASRYYAKDYRVLRKFARHYSTGEVIPEKLVKSLNGARDMFAATEMHRQVYLVF